jgi:ABC-type sugar transport system substrate-binding protein
MLRKVSGFLVLSISTALAVVACGKSGESAPTAASATAETAGTSKYNIIDDTYTIGWIGWGNTDYVGQSIEAFCKYLDVQMPEVEWVFSSDGIDQAKAAAQVEAWCQSGVDVIIQYLPTAAIADICKRYDVWYGAGTNLVSDQNLIKYLEDSGIWLGYNPFGKEREDAARCMQALYDTGARNFVVVGSQPGHPAGDGRAEGAVEWAAMHNDVKILNTYRGESDQVTALSDFLALYGNQIEGVYLTTNGLGQFPGCINALDAAGSSARIAVSDLVFDAIPEYESGRLVYCAGGNGVAAGTMLPLAMNALMGYYDGPVYLYPDYIGVYTGQDYNDFNKYIDGSVPAYTADEIRDWMKCYNPDVTGSGYKEYIESTFTLPSVKERHADIVK